MAPVIPSAKLTLSCPLFAADFDPRNYGFLLVGGGGGEGRSGVGNKIALLNTSKRSEISEVVDIELSRDEDSVTSLAAAQASDDSIIALAGINSSVAEQKRNNNQHLRSFQIDYPPRKAVTASASEKEAELPKDKPKSTTPGKTTPLARVSLFRTKETKARADTYQRILRLSPWKGADKPRVGATATGLAASGEIVFFDVTPTPTESDVIGRIRLNSDEEAEDVDIIDLEGAKYRVAYTTGSDVFVCDISSQTRSNASPEVKCVYRIPLPDKGPRARFKFRALRFLTPTTVLLLQNAPNRNGCELVTLDIHQTASKDKPLGTIVRRKKLRKTIKIGLGLDVCGLGTNPDGQEQTIIAVSGSDQSIEILTVEYNPRRGHDKLRPYTSLREVHPFSMTKICFSHFQPPAHPVTPETPPQYIKLASISMGNTVVVHTFPLAPAPPSSRTPRYVLVMPGESEVWTNFASGFAALLSILTVCLLLQAFTEIRGLMPPYLGATEWLPPDIRTAIARPYHALPPHPLPSGPVLPAVREQPPRSLRDILHAHRAAEANTDDDTDASAKTPVSSVLIQCRPDSNDIFIETPGSESSLSGMSSADEREKQQPQSPPRSWDDLDEAERSLWKQRLTDAGYWALEEGETILKGVVFGECSAFLGNQVQAGLLS